MRRTVSVLAALAAVAATVPLTGCGGGGGGAGNGGAVVGRPTFRDSAGEATSTFSPSEAVLASFAGCEPGRQYDVSVRDAVGQEVAYLRLTPLHNGWIPDTVLAYDVSPGRHTVTVEAVQRGRVASAQSSQQYTFSVAAEAVRPIALVQDATDPPRSAFRRGEDVYVRGEGLPPDREVLVYVVADQMRWEHGMSLEDLSGFAEDLPPPSRPDRGPSVDPMALRGHPDVVVTDATGAFAPVRVWQNVQAEDGASFDVVVDADCNGVYSPGDAVMDHQNVGFVIQGSGTHTSQAGHWRAQLVCDANQVYTDFLNTTDNVYIYVNPQTQMQLRGDRWVKKYICLHRANWTAGTPLVDVSGPGNVSQWEADTPRSGCTNEGRVLVWPATLTAGDYDAIIDVNRNDVYDPGVDIIDGGLPSQPGFTVGRVTAKKWTVLIYLDADDLVAAGEADLAEMQTVGSNDQVNIVVQHDTPGGAYRYYILPDTRDQLADLGHISSGTASTLSQFLAWGMARFPADRYMVVIWNHGNGFVDSRSVGTTDICWDENPSPSVLTVPQMRQALAAINRHIDVLGIDACLMGMWEVAREMEGLCDFLVYSQENIPGTGWPYDRVLQRIRANPDLAARELAHAIPGDYIATIPTGQSRTLSCLDMSRMPSLDQALDAWAREMITGIDAARADLQAAISQADFYGRPRAEATSRYPDYRDLYGYAQAVRHSVTQGRIAADAQAVMNALSAAVISHEETGVHRNVSHGMTIWLPPDTAHFNNNALKYGNLMAARHTQWDEFLAALWGMSMRIELSWGHNPRDLDSHLFDAQTPPRHLYYAHTDIPGANLDRDDVDGHGPENVSITTFIPGPRGRYDYAVYLYSGTVPQDAPAVVRVFRGGSSIAERTFQSSGFSYDTRWWYVFTVDPATAGITPVDRMQSVAPASAITAEQMPHK